MPPGSQEGESQEEAQNTPVVYSKGDVLSILNLEGDVGVHTAKRSAVNLVASNGGSLKVTLRLVDKSACVSRDGKHYACSLDVFEGIGGATLRA